MVLKARLAAVSSTRNIDRTGCHLVSRNLWIGQHGTGWIKRRRLSVRCREATLRIYLVSREYFERVRQNGLNIETEILDIFIDLCLAYWKRRTLKITQTNFLKAFAEESIKRGWCFIVILFAITKDSIFITAAKQMKFANWLCNNK